MQIVAQYIINSRITAQYYHHICKITDTKLLQYHYAILPPSMQDYQHEITAVIKAPVSNRLSYHSG